MKRIQARYFLFFLIILIFLLVGIALVYKSRSKPLAVSSSPSPQPQASASPMTQAEVVPDAKFPETATKVSGWREYSSSKLHIAFQHPSNVQVKEDDEGIRLFQKVSSLPRFGDTLELADITKDFSPEKNLYKPSEASLPTLVPLMFAQKAYPFSKYETVADGDDFGSSSTIYVAHLNPQLYVSIFDTSEYACKKVAQAGCVKEERQTTDAQIQLAHKMIQTLTVATEK